MTEKRPLDKKEIARRLAQEFQNGMLINLGGGLPSQACNYIPKGREVIFHSENGLICYGALATSADADWNLFNANLQPVTPLPGMVFVSHEECFDIIRGGHIDISALGALQVSEKGDLANWARGDLKAYDDDIVNWIKAGNFPPAVGGGMDLASGAKRIIVAMIHTTKEGEPKIVRECSYELTGRRCVSTIITDLAVIDVTDRGLVLRETAPGYTVEEIQAVTEPKLMVSSDLKVMEI